MFNFLKKFSFKSPVSFSRMFPDSLSADVMAATKIMPPSKLSPHKGESVVCDSQTLEIYSRIYNPEPDSATINQLTENQKLVLDCIYTRHHDGTIRERHLRNIFPNQKSWTVPYVLLLLGEYVEEIIGLVKNDLVEGTNQELYRKFVSENPAFWKKTKARVISYWNVYFRTKFEKIEQYPGMEIVRIIEEG